MITTVLLFTAGLALLYAGGEGLIRSAATLGMRFGMTPIVAGLTIVAFSTSAPELAVSLDAALEGIPGLAVGNVVGSNICNIALILGLTAMIRPPALRNELVLRDVHVMLFSSFLIPAMLLIDGSLSRLEGGVLLVGIVSYVFVTVRGAEHTADVAAEVEAHADTLFGRSIPVNVPVAAISVVCLVYGSRFFVSAAVEIATTLGVPEAVVGLSAAALGTSIPELAASIIAAKGGRSEMAAGNLIGSNIFNLLLILGATAVVQPLTLGGITVLDMAVMIGVTLLALVFILGTPRLGRGAGAILFSCYVGYMVWLFAQAF